MTTIEFTNNILHIGPQRRFSATIHLHTLAIDCTMYTSEDEKIDITTAENVLNIFLRCNFPLFCYFFGTLFEQHI